MKDFESKKFWKHSILGIIWIMIFYVVQILSILITAELYMKFTDVDIISMDNNSVWSLMSYKIYIVEGILAFLIYQAFKFKTRDERIRVKQPLPTIFMIPYGLTINFILVLFVSIFPQDVLQKLGYNLTAYDLVGTESQPFWIVLLGAGICAPIAEEIFYRFFLFNNLSKAWNGLYACLFSAFLFGIMHGNIIQGFYTAIIGFNLAHIYYLTGGRLSCSILVHCTINIFSIVLANFCNPEYQFVVQLAIIILSWLIANMGYRVLNQEKIK